MNLATIHNNGTTTWATARRPLMWGIFAAFVLSVLSVPAHAGPPDEVFNPVKDATVLGKTRGAEGTPGRTLVAAGPSQAEWIQRSRALEQSKDWQGLRELGQTWTESEPQNPTTWYVLGIACLQLARYPEAVDAYREAVRLDPERADAWHNLGFAYANLARYPEAVDAYRQAVRINPRDANAWHNLGFAYANLARYPEAVDVYREAVRLNPERADAWYSLGVNYTSLNRYADAIEPLREAVRLNPDYADAWHLLCVAYAGSGDRIAALECVRTLRRLDPARADALFNVIGPR